MTELDNAGGVPWWKCIFPTLALLSAAAAGGESAARTWWVHQVAVDPAMKIEYEEAAREFLQELDTNLSLRIDAVESAESRYTFFATLDDSGSEDHDPQDWVSTLRRISQEKTRSLEARGLVTASGENGWVLSELPDLSYAPAGYSPRQPGFVRYTFHYVEPDKEKAAVRVLSDLRELYEKKGVASAIGALRSAGEDGTLIYVVSEKAETRDDFLEQQEELSRRLEGKGRSLRGKLRSSLLQTEIFEGIRRPDLSYPASRFLPSEMAEKARIAPLEPLPPEPPPPVRAKVVPLEPLPPESPPPSAPATDLERMVRQWAKAWSDQRVEDYLDFYSRDFWPPGDEPRSVWETRRRQRLEAPSFIEVTVSSFAALMQGPGAAWVEFIQRYRSDSYGDVVTKRLELAREDGGWKIVQEQAAPLELP